MKQEFIAGFIFCIMGCSFLILSPASLWAITEKWKTRGSGQPSGSYIIIMWILGLLFAGTGGVLILCSL